MRRITMIALGVLTALTLAGAASGGGSATLFGGATVDNGNVKLVSDLSDGSTANDFSGINFEGTGVTTFSSLTTLRTRFNVTDDDCGAGSPRFQLNFGTQNVFVYLGPSPTFTGCTQNTFLDSGNLIGNNDACRYDTSQIVAGTQCNTYAGTLALVGTMTLTGIQLVVDSGFFFADKEQTVLVCGVQINANEFFRCRGPGAGNGNGRDRVTICHHTSGKNGTRHVTITISRSALAAHQRHGDTVGACNSPAARAAHAKKAHAKKFHKRGRR